MIDIKKLRELAEGHFGYLEVVDMVVPARTMITLLDRLDAAEKVVDAVDVSNRYWPCEDEYGRCEWYDGCPYPKYMEVMGG